MVEGIERKLRQVFVQAEAAAEEEIRRVKEESAEEVRAADLRTEEERERADTAELLAETEAAARVEAEEQARHAKLDLKIERERRERNNAVIQQFKLHNAELTAERSAAEDAKRAAELKAAELNCALEHKDETIAEILARLVATEDERCETQRQLQREADKVRTLELDQYLPKRDVHAHLFCPKCDRPYRKWDGEQYFCLDCDR